MSSIRRINPVDSVVRSVNTYLLDSDLSIDSVVQPSNKWARMTCMVVAVYSSMFNICNF